MTMSNEPAYPTSSFATRSTLMPRDSSRTSSLSLVAIAHVAVYYFLALLPAREAISEASALMVTLIHEQPRAEQKPTELAKPQPVKLQQVLVEPIPVSLIATTSAPADVTATPPVLSQPVPTTATMPVPLPTAVPPRFDADYLDNPAPVYPALSRRMGEEGKVMLRVFVEASGAASQLEIRTSSGSQRLDSAAIEAVRRWKFAPAKQGDKFVAAWVLVPINFSLRG